jgi:hypothetical protein
MNSGVCKWCGLEVSGEPVMAGERFMTLIWDWTRTRVGHAFSIGVGVGWND